VRWIIAIAIGVIFSGLVACSFDLPGQAAKNPMVATMWRRTTSGWEKVSALLTERADQLSNDETVRGYPHPLVLSLLVALISTTALVAFAPTAPAPAKKPFNRSQVADVPLRSLQWLESGENSASFVPLEPIAASVEPSAVSS
jgi:hypothetical protein